MRVLIVDHDLKTADRVAGWLTAAGHNVRTVNTCWEAERVALVFRPEVVVLHIGLPDGDGWHLAPLLKPAKIIAVAASRKNAGIDHYLSKPISREEILTLLEGMRSDVDGTHQAGG